MDEIQVAPAALAVDLVDQEVLEATMSAVDGTGARLPLRELISLRTD